MLASLDDPERRKVVGVQSRFDLECSLLDESAQLVRIESIDHIVGDEYVGELTNGGNPVAFEKCPLDSSGPGHEHQRVCSAPLRFAERIELTELTVVAWLGTGRSVRGLPIEESGELGPKTVPVRPDVGGPDRLELSGTEPNMEVGRCIAGESLDCVGIEAQLQNVSRLRCGAGELGIDRLPVIDARLGVGHPDQEVGDAAHALVHEGHLVDDVDVGGEQVPHSVDPRLERLASFSIGNVEHGHTHRSELRQTVSLVGVALVDEKLGERSERLC
jgi:hypothetical protein